MNELDEAKFQMKALLLTVVQFVEGAEHDLQETREVFFGEQCGGARGAGAFVGGDLQQFGAFGRRVRAIAMRFRR